MREWCAGHEYRETGSVEADDASWDKGPFELSFGHSLAPLADFALGHVYPAAEIDAFLEAHCEEGEDALGSCALSEDIWNISHMVADSPGVLQGSFRRRRVQ